MKFVFCGGQSVPEWFLSQLNLISNLSFIKLRKICNLYVTSMVDPEQKESSLEQITEILAGGDFNSNECQTVIAIVDFVICNAARNQTDHEVLLKELIDLGIPKENCQSLCKIYESNLEKLRSTFQQKTLRLNRFDSLSVKKWNFVRTSEGNKKNMANQEYFRVDIDLTGNKLDGQSNKIAFCTDKAQLTRFTDEMTGIMKLLNKKSQ